jgi:hypothetical protein
MPVGSRNGKSTLAQAVGESSLALEACTLFVKFSADWHTAIAFVARVYARRQTYSLLELGRSPT